MSTLVNDQLSNVGLIGLWYQQVKCTKMLPSNYFLSHFGGEICFRRRQHRYNTMSLNNRLMNGSTPRVSVTTPTPSTATRGKKYPEIKQTGYYSDVVGPGARAEIGVRLILFYFILFRNQGCTHHTNNIIWKNTQLGKFWPTCGLSTEQRILISSGVHVLLFVFIIFSHWFIYCI